MPQAIPLIAMLVVEGAKWYVQAAVLFAASYVAAKMQNSMLKKPPATNSDTAGRQQIVRGSTEPHRIIVGQVTVSGPLVFADSTGEKDEYLHLVIALAGHEVEEIGEIYLNDTPLTGSKWGNYVRVNRHLGHPDQLADADLVIESNQWTDNHRLRGIAYIYVRLYWPAEKGYEVWPTGLPNIKALVKGAKYLDPRTGLTAYTNNAALAVRGYLAAEYGMACPATEIDDSLMIAAANICDEIIDPGPLADLNPIACDWQFKSTTNGFTSDGTLTPSGEYAIFSTTSGMITKSISIAGLSFSGAGNRFIRIKIRSVVSPIWGGSLYWSTAGHAFSSSYRASIPMPGVDGEFHFIEIDMHAAAWGASDWTGNIITGLKFIFSGNGTSTTYIEWITVGNRDDQLRYSCNGSYTLDMDPPKIVEGLLSACVGQLCYSQGKYKHSVGAYTGAETIGLTESDLRDTIKVRPRPARASLFNGVRGVFVSPADGYQPTDFPAVQNSLYVTQDGGEQIWADVDLPYTTDPVAAQRLAKIHLERARQGIIVEFPAKLTAMRYLPGDVVPVTVALLGWDAKEFRVLDYTEPADGGGIDLILQEEAAGVYDWNFGQATKYDPAPDTQLPDPGYCAPPTDITVQSGTDQLTIGGDGTINPAMLISWSAPSGSFITGYQVEWQRVGSETWNQIPSTDTQTLITGKLADGERYNVRVRAINGIGAPSVWLNYYNHTVVGKTEPPPPPTTFIVDRQPDGTREFRGSYTNKPADFAGWNIYYQLGTGQTIATMALLNSAGLLTAMPFESNQLAAGSYTFALTAVDTSGLESAPLYIETTLADPRLGDVIFSVYPESNGWPGSKTDCHVDNNSWLEADSVATWDTLPATWDSWDRWNFGAISPISYEEPQIDLGFISTFTPLISMIGDGTPTVEINYSSDGSTWSGWVTPVQVDARYLKVRVSVVGVAPLIKRLPILLSGVAIQEEINDLATSSLTGSYRIAAGDIRLPVTKPFNRITQVQIALQSVGPGWSWEIIDKDTAVGPRIKIYNASSTLADASIDANIRGL